jgi:molybdopterin converting factor small subunit
MSVRFLFFASAAGFVGRSQLDVPIRRPLPLLELMKRTAPLFPLVDETKWIRVAVNNEFSDYGHEVKNGDEVAFIPPVSGG